MCSSNFDWSIEIMDPGRSLQKEHEQTPGTNWFAGRLPVPGQPRSQGLSSSRPRKRERGETLVGAGHVSPREKVDPGRGPSPASLCQDLLSTPKRGLRFVARRPRETHLSGYVFQ